MAKPKPSPPILDPEEIVHEFLILEKKILTLSDILQFSPISTPGPIKVLTPICVLSPILAVLCIKDLYENLLLLLSFLKSSSK